MAHLFKPVFSADRSDGITLQQHSIGVFDSGVGGLTVLRAIHQRLPHESILYFGDTARLPYGTRSQAEILQFVRDILHWMQTQQVKLVVMACNTSSALALDIVRAEFDLPILGVILPAARAAVRAGRRVGVIATSATANSRAYTSAMTEIDPAVQVWEMGCPDFVPLIEQNRIHDRQTRRVARQYLAPLLQQQIDVLVYGCTHYPHLDPVIHSLLPPGIQRVNPAVYTATAVAQELDLLGLRNPGSVAQTRFCVSDRPERFAQLASQWLGYEVQVEQIDLTPDLTRPDLSTC
ncbi:MAG: glutamate racemase [Synechococcales bacterium]|nr:glutamate racemase [Synechococcales bacterium]